MTPTATSPAAPTRPRKQRPARPTFPRRVSGPITGAPRERPGVQQPRLPLRAARAIRALPDHPLFDRVVRGRAWIPLLGVLLAGIVAMQVEALKLGTSIGRSIEQTSSLSTRNEALRESVAALADEQRIERLAAAMGMVMPAPTAIGFLAPANGLTIHKALRNIHQPNAPQFLALTTSNGSVVTGISSTSSTVAASSAAASSAAAASAQSPATSGG